MEFNGLTLIVLIVMVFICMIVFWTFLNTVYGIQYCGYKQYTNCKSIDQNIPIPVSSIQNLDEVLKDE